MIFFLNPLVLHVASDIILAKFVANDQHLRSWQELNDPVMGGQSSGTFTTTNGSGIFDGEVRLVPSLNAPGFIKAQTDDSSPFDSIEHCDSIYISAKAKY